MAKSNPTLVIAEAGVNHNGDLKLAMQLIDAAFESGADVIKFQTFSACQVATAYADQAAYQQRNLDTTQNQLSMLQRLELQADDHYKLIDYCHNRNIDFLSTAFDFSSIELLSRLNLKYWKVPSGEITNLPYLRLIGSQGKPVILSTGMSNLGEIESALSVLESAGTPRSNITVLHCTTEYPAPLNDVNLRAMQTIAQSFGVQVGYSDHTDGIFIPISAVAMGATVIEKHLTLDRNLPGPDHKASLEPDQFRSMVQGIRNIELALGDGIKRPSRSELSNRLVVRKSIVSSRPIRAGDLLTEDNITVKRPGTGISPMFWDEWIGRVASRDFSVDELIQ